MHAGRPRAQLDERSTGRAFPASGGLDLVERELGGAKAVGVGRRLLGAHGRSSERQADGQR